MYDELKKTEAKAKPAETQERQKKDKSISGMLQRTIQDLEKIKSFSSGQNGSWEIDKNACRGKLALIFPDFEEKIRRHSVTKEGNNAELFRRILNLRV